MKKWPLAAEPAVRSSIGNMPPAGPKRVIGHFFITLLVFQPGSA
jgi:hypothetical protein